MRSIRFAVLSNARKYVTERVAKNGRNDLFSVSLVLFLTKQNKYGIIVLNRTMVRGEIYFCSFGINIKR